MIHQPIQCRTQRLTERKDVATIDEASPRLTGDVGLTGAEAPEEDEQRTADPPKKARCAKSSSISCGP